MAGKRQHFIPRMLLLGFADANEGVWVGRKDREPFGVNITGVGVEGMFYGVPGPGTADEAITREEPRIEQLLRRMTTMPAGTCDSQAAASVISHFTSRTRAMRRFMEDLGRLAVSHLRRRMDDPLELRSMMSTHLRDNPGLIEDEIDKGVLRQSGPVGLAIFRGHPMRSWVLAYAYRKAAVSIQSLDRESFNAAGGVDFLSAVLVGLPQIVRRAHARVALQSPTPEERTTHLASFSYAVEDHSDPLILGDGVAWGIRSSAGVCPLFSIEDDIECVVMPITSRRALHGWRGERRALSTDDINHGSASTSSEFVVASGQGPQVSLYVKHIGAVIGAALDATVTDAMSEH